MEFQVPVVVGIWGMNRQIEDISASALQMKMNKSENVKLK